MINGARADVIYSQNLDYQMHTFLVPVFYIDDKDLRQTGV